MEHADHSHPVRAVCGWGSAAVRTGVLEKATCLNMLTLLFELGAVFFLVQSMLSVFPDGPSNWYLPLTLGLNAIALFLNAAQRMKNKRKYEK